MIIKEQDVLLTRVPFLMYRFMLGFPSQLLYPDSGISMDEEIVLGDMIWSYNKAEL